MEIKFATNTIVKKIATIKLPAKLNAENLESFEQSMRTLHSSGMDVIELDCLQLSYLNSAALGTILSFHKKLIAGQKDGIVLSNVNDAVFHIFATTNLDQFLKISRSN